MQLWRQNQHLAASVELYYTELQEAFAQLAGQVQVRLMLTVALQTRWLFYLQAGSCTLPHAAGHATTNEPSSQPRRQR